MAIKNEYLLSVIETVKNCGIDIADDESEEET